MKLFGTFGRRLAVGLALATTTTAGLVFGVSSSAAGFGLRLDSVTEEEQPVAHLQVVEQVVNDNGGTTAASDFKLAVKAGSPNPAEFNGDGSGTDVTLDAGPYAVSQETALGYLTTLSPDCQGTIEAGET